LIAFGYFNVNLPPPSREMVLLQFLAGGREGGDLLFY
jgi:hypothetical protein